LENLTVGSVYGTALYEAARDLGKTDEFLDAAKLMAEMFRNNPEFFLLLRTPSIAPAERRELARKVFDGRVPKELLNFIYVLIGKRRIGQFIGIVGAYEKAVNAFEGVSKGTIESAAPLSADQISRFETETSKLLRKNIKLEPIANERLIGGVRIYVDGKLIDASIRRKLDELKEKIIS
jgi:ATP synthase F1 delta subunit